MTKIVVTVESGCLRGVYCSDPEAKIRLFDFDNVEDDPEIEEAAEEEFENEIVGLTEVY